MMALAVSRIPRTVCIFCSPGMNLLAAVEFLSAISCLIALPTSVVYGMPREAALLGAAERVLPLGEIGTAVAGYWR